MNADEAVRAWIGAWERAWPKDDVDSIAARYGNGRVYASHPFRPAETARSYLERAFGEESLVTASFGEPVVAEDRAAVEYWAVLRRVDGSEMTIAGASFLRFDRDGLVCSHRDYWDQVDGNREPPPGWGD